MTHVSLTISRTQRRLTAALASAVFTVLSVCSLPAQATAPAVSISQIPMTVAIPAHPQIMLALGNSQSMDGTLSGAIMTGSGSLSSYPLLDASSSPVNYNYTVDASFTPPVNLGTVACGSSPCAAITSSTPAGTAASAPYTVTVGSNLVDNSGSRLNVAKQGITTILNNYIDSADFGLMDFSTSGLGEYTTWVYQMSPSNGFQWVGSTSGTTATAGSAVLHAGNNFYANEAVTFTGSFGSVTGLTPASVYYVSSTGLSSAQFEVSATPGGAVITPGGTGSVAINTNAASSTPAYTTTVSAGNAALLANNDFVAYQAITFSGSFGNLTGFLPGTTYYVSSTGLSASQYELSATPGGAVITPAGSGGAVVFANTEYIVNPCNGVTTTGSGLNEVQKDCAALVTYYPSQPVLTAPFIQVSFSSDDPSINDVLYAPAGYADPVCVVYGGPSPATPFPPNDSLVNYEDGSVLETYSHEVGSLPCAPETGPTNAGYVPYTSQVMYELRGFGYYTSSEPTGVNTTPLVAMTSSGATPTATTVANAIAKFTSYLAPETNSTGTSEIKAVATQSPLATLIESAAQYFITKNPTSTNGCNAQRYVVLLTDGLPTLDLSGHSWPPLGSTAAAGYGVTASFNSDGSLAVTNDQALTDTITQLTNAANAGIKTYIIGLGAGVSPASNQMAANTLTAMAVAGGTNNYFPAYSPQDLSADLDIIIRKILSATQATASAAVNSTGLNTSSVVYQSQFTTSDTYQDWTGNLLAYSVNATTGQVNTASPQWSAQTQLDTQVLSSGQASRIIATWDSVAGAATPFEWTTGSPTTGIAATTVLGQQLETFTPDTSGQDVLNFVRGANGNEVRFGGQFRNRTHRLGDIVDSAPLYIGAPIASYSTPSYTTFANVHASRPPVIYVGANDGMLHAFDATTGNERFAYIPKGGYANLVKLVNPYYNAQHQYFVNGSPVGADVQFADGSWHTLVVASQAQGGSSVFALDVTNPQLITSESALAQAVLWDFTDASNAALPPQSTVPASLPVDMGLTFSNPVIANTNAGWLVFVGNGYNSPNSKPVLYALNAQTGAVVKKIDLCAALTTNVCNMGVANGLSSIVTMNTSGQVTQASNVVYAGDLEGNLWRVDISNASPSNWKVTVMFEAKDSSGNAQPITTAPAVTLNPNFPKVTGTMVYVGTGQLLGTPDLTTTQTQSVYGVFDPQTGSTTPLTRGNPIANSSVSTTGMVVQNLSIPTSNNQVVVDTGNPVSYPTNTGWYVDLNIATGLSASQRVVTNPALESGGALVFTTYQPNFNGTLCTENGQSYLYVLNYATGGMFGTPQFDINNDGQINAGDTVQVPNPNNSNQSIYVPPVGLLLGNVYAAAPTIRTANFTTAAAVKLITLSSDQIKTVVEKGNPMSRRAWWEIRQ